MKSVQTPVRREDAAADRLVKYLNKFLHSERAMARSCLLYKIVIDGSGKIEPTQKSDYLRPKRRQIAFQADIVIRDKKSQVPLVVIELKYGTFSTHDVLTYSTKALRHKEIYPYLRYGFAIAGGKHINEKFFLHNVGFDFALAFPERPGGRNGLRELVERQIKIARSLIDRKLHGNVYRFETKVEIQ
jgi:hypothetical protein